jgi:hypothetical protein
LNAVGYEYGFRIVGACTGQRRYVHAPTAFLAYCGCDEKACVSEEAYLSAFQFGDAFVEHLTRTRSTAGYAGPTCAPWIWIDIDSSVASGGLEKALHDTRQLINVLDEKYGVPRQLPIPFFSGSKGFHLGIPTTLWTPAPNEYFHAEARAFAETIAAAANISIDASVYDRVRAFRAPNSRHPKTGLHKRYIESEMLDTITVRGVLSIAASPASFTLPDVAAAKSPDMLVAVWDAAQRRVAAEVQSLEDRRRAITNGDAAATITRSTREFLAGHVVVGERQVALYRATANLVECGASLALAADLLREPALNIGLPPREVERTIKGAYEKVSGRR